MATNANTQVFNVLAYGATGDGITDDSAAIRSAIAAAGHYGTLYFPAGVGYRTTTGLVIPAGISVLMDGPLLFDAPTSTYVTALTIGSGNEQNRTQQFQLNVQRVNQSNFSSQADIGVELVNAFDCDINLIQISGFCVGLSALGTNNFGFVYNNIRLLRIINNQFGLDLTQSQSGWCNENLWIGGNFDVPATSVNHKSRYGVRITSRDGSYTNNNNNVFIKPSFELEQTVASPGEAIPVLIEYGSQNTFYACRSEDNHTSFARLLHDSHSNRIDLGYVDKNYVLDDQSANPTSQLTQLLYLNFQRTANCIFDSGPLPEHATPFNSQGSLINVEGVHLSNGSNPAAEISASHIIIYDRYLELTPWDAGIGIFVSTNTNKQFILRRDTEPGHAGRIRIACYNAQNQIIGNASTLLVKTNASQQMYWDGYVGGCYQTGQDFEQDFYFQVDASVDHIRILMCGGSAALQIRSFGLYAIEEGHPTVWTGLENMVPFQSECVVDALPGSGAWQKGRFVNNLSLTNGTNLGWVCTVSGTACLTPWAAHTAYAKGVRVYAHSDVYECVIAGTSGTNAPSGTATSISDGTVKWGYVSKQAEFRSVGLLSP